MRQRRYFSSTLARWTVYVGLVHDALTSELTPNNPPRPAFSLIELLVALSILTIAVGIVMPTVQHSRETARRLSCQSNLRQLGHGIQIHAEVYRHYPSNGWGSRWVADASRGTGINQPGGWIYQVLPFIEQSSLHERFTVSGTSSDADEPIATPVSLFHCPSRRPVRPYVYSGSPSLVNRSDPKLTAKSDYAGNGGDFPFYNFWGPLSTNAADIAAFVWPDTAKHSGIFFCRSWLAEADVTDGTSNTYLVGEKYVNPRADTSHAQDLGDNQTMYLGDSWDIRRSAYLCPTRDTGGIFRLNEFGSAHVAACHFVFCDGSVRAMAYSMAI